MNQTRIYTARFLVPVTSSPIEDGALAVHRGRIVGIGPRREVTAAQPGAAVVDFGDAVVLPPLVNAHVHLELSRFPSWSRALGETQPPDSFVNWILQVIRVKRSIDPDEYRPALQEGICQCLEAGTGAVGDILSWYPARRAYCQSPLYGRCFFETLGQDPESCRRTLKRIGDLLDEGRQGRLEPGISPHAPYTLAQSCLEAVYASARGRRTATSIHLAESAAETAFFKDASGPLAKTLYPAVGWEEQVPAPPRRTPLEHLARCGGLSSRTLLVHGVHVTGSDIERIARTGCAVVLCPRSNARLGGGRAPLEGYLAAGVPLSLGTDSLASVDSLSMWDEMAFARGWFGEGCSCRQLLEMATVGGARALGLAGEMGGLEPGCGGHFQVLVPRALPPLSELEEFLCSFGRTAEVKELYLDGRPVLSKLS